MPSVHPSRPDSVPAGQGPLFLDAPGALPRGVEDLLVLRFELARLAGELRSHYMPELGEVERRLMVIEALIAQVYPAVAAGNARRWMEQEHNELTHLPGRRTRNCRICALVSYGTGHGRPRHADGLTVRHARLAVDLTAAECRYLALTLQDLSLLTE